MVNRGTLGARGSTFSVLIVCSANRYRSPLAQHLLLHSLRSRGLDWAVRSAGTTAVPGDLMAPRVQAILTRRGIEAGEWRSTLLDRSMVDSADLILTADQTQRRQIVLLNAAGVRRTFTLLNFARLASLVPSLGDGTPVESGEALLNAAVAARAHLQPLPPGAEDVTDPAGRHAHVVRDCADVISAAVDQITAAVKN